MILMTAGKCRHNAKEGIAMKKVIALILILAMTAGMSACAKKVSPDADSVKAETSEETQASQTEAAGETDAVKEEQAKTAESELPEEIKGYIHASVTEVTESRNLESDPYVKLIETAYPRITLSDEDAKKYPELVAAVNKENEAYKKDAEGQMEDHAAEAAENYELRMEDGTLDFFPNYEYNTSQKVARADSRVFSVYNEFYSWLGGVHGYYAYWGDNYDVADGRLLSITDVITDLDAYGRIVIEKLSAQYQDIDLELAKEKMENLAGGEEESLPFLIGYEGVTCFFNPYDIAAYASGAQIITVTFDEAPGVFNDKYVHTPEDYVTPLPQELTEWIDVDDDGITDPVYIVREWDSDSDGENNFCKWNLFCSDKQLRIQDDCYSMDSYLVKKGGQYYVYLFQLSDNDYMILRVIDLKTMNDAGSDPVNMCIAGGGYDYEELENGYKNRRTTMAFTDPDSFVMSTVIDALGTMAGLRTYHVDSNGFPVSDVDYYTTETGLVLQAKKDIACKLVDADENVLGDDSLKAGKYYQVIRTDDMNWIDLQEVDKALVHDEEHGDEDYSYRTIWEEDFRADMTKPVYRLEQKLDEYPRLIRNEDESELFDGIQYAG